MFLIIVSSKNQNRFCFGHEQHPRLIRKKQVSLDVEKISSLTFKRKAGYIQRTCQCFLFNNLHPTNQTCRRSRIGSASLCRDAQDCTFTQLWVYPVYASRGGKEEGVLQVSALPVHLRG